LAEDLRRVQRARRTWRDRGRLERAVRWCRRNPAVTLLSGAAASSCWGLFDGRVGQRAEGHAEDAQRAAGRAEANLAEAGGSRGREKESFTLAHQAVDEFCLRLRTSNSRASRHAGGTPRPVRFGLRYYEKFVKFTARTRRCAAAAGLPDPHGFHLR